MHSLGRAASQRCGVAKSAYRRKHENDEPNLKRANCLTKASLASASSTLHTSDRA